jgi:hypothetical protein
VTVRDACDATATRKIRNTGGTWRFVSYTCGYSVDVTDSCTWEPQGWGGYGWTAVQQCTAIYQDKKQYQKVQLMAGSSGSTCEGMWSCWDVDVCNGYGYMGVGDNCLFFSTFCLGCAISGGTTPYCYRTVDSRYYEWRC